MFPSSSPRARVLPALAVVVALLLVASCSSDDDAAEPTVPESSAATADEPAPSDAAATTVVSGEFDPYSQTLEWSECEWGECATATVPIDYDDPSAGTTTIAMSRVSSTGTDPIGTLFVNPGGPGQSGLFLPGEFETRAAPEVLESYDIVGFDPRGVGASDPIVCLDDAGLDELHAFDFAADDEASVNAYAELVQGQADACLANSPELAKHVTTVETAKDMDVMRALVGDDELHYVGFSYGTFLGNTYAALFPDKVAAMVLDGPEDPTLSEADKTLRVLGGLQTAFDDFAADCVADECPLGATVDEIDQKLATLFETTKDQPLPTGDTERPLTRPLAFVGVLDNLYSQDLWPTLTDALAAAFDGDGTGLLASSDSYYDREDGVYTTNSQVITAINCLDAQIAPPSEGEPAEDDFVTASSVFGEIAYDSSGVGCDQWPIQPTVTAPDYTVPGAVPIIVVGTTGDPVTPYENAVKLAEELDSGVLLIRVGEGHTAYFDNMCIAAAVNAYLIDGTVPDDGTECDDAAEIDESASEETAADANHVGIVAGDDILSAEWTSCTWDGTALTMSGEGADDLAIEATTGNDGAVEVEITGPVEWTASGTTELVDNTLFVSGTGTNGDGATGDVFINLDITDCS